MVELENDPLLKLVFAAVKLLPRVDDSLHRLCELHAFGHPRYAEEFATKCAKSSVFKERDMIDLEVLNGEIRTLLDGEWQT